MFPSLSREGGGNQLVPGVRFERTSSLQREMITILAGDPRGGLERGGGRVFSVLPLNYPGVGGPTQSRTGDSRVSTGR